MHSQPPPPPPIAPFLDPLFAVAGIALVALAAALLGRLIPFYRRELKAEDATRLTPLDGLRGVLAFAVLFHHAAVTLNYFNTGVWEAPRSAAFYTMLGQTAVALFFCMTGFLFWSRVLATRGEIEPWPFLRARFFRIAPLYVLGCVVVLVLLSDRVFPITPASLKGLLAMATMGVRPWHAMGRVDPRDVNAGVTWTLQWEWAFYFALPALALLARAPGGARRVAFLVLALFVFGNDRYLYFVSGILAAHAAGDERIAALLRRAPVTVAVLALLALLPFVAGDRAGRSGFDGYGYVAEGMTTLIFVPIACGNSVFGLLNRSGLRLMGLVSYSVYLLHGIGLYAARPLLAAAENDARGPLVYWSYVLILALAVLAVSLTTYRWVELPFIQWEKKRRQRP